MAGWEPTKSSGLIDDTDITITKAEFNYDAGYAGGEQLVLILEGTSDHPEHPEFRQFYSIGKGWETNDRGATVESNLDGFNEQTQYWKFIEAALDTDAAPVLAERGFPSTAAIWEGLRFHVKRKDVDYGGQIGVKQVLVPTKFLGEVGDNPKAETPATEAPAEAPAAPAGASNGILEAKLKGLAHSATSHNDFIEKVLEAHGDEVQADMDLYARVVDPAGLYAEVKG